MRSGRNTGIPRPFPIAPLNLPRSVSSGPLDVARPSLVLLIRVLDTNPVQESPVIRRIDCRLCVRQIRRCRSETFSPTIRERFHCTNISAAPWTSPVNNEVVRCGKADCSYLLRHSTTLARQRQCAIFHLVTPSSVYSASQPALLTNVGGKVGARLNSFRSPTPRQ
jgi:hypothetical protein